VDSSLDVSVSRSIRALAQSRLGQIGKCLGLSLGIEGFGLGIGLGQLGLVHIPIAVHA